MTNELEHGGHESDALSELITSGAVAGQEPTSKVTTLPASNGHSKHNISDATGFMQRWQGEGPQSVTLQRSHGKISRKLRIKQGEDMPYESRSL